MMIGVPLYLMMLCFLATIIWEKVKYNSEADSQS